jgi:hypothetical protein
MVWRALIPFLRPLVPVAVDYARARMQNVQREQTASVAPAESVESLEARLSDAEAQIHTLANLCNDLGNELARFSAETNARIKSARNWGLLLLAWNLALTLALLVLLLR